jgi:hypothetical protein
VAHDADLHLDALQPLFGAEVSEVERLTGTLVDAVVCSPWFTVLDIAVPLLVQQARVVACIPGSYLASGVSARYRFLRQLNCRMRAAWWS